MAGVAGAVIGAHPRSRGEHGNVVPCCRVGVGSSPLARGALGECLYVVAGEGLIPARAGSTPAGATPAATATAHPRSRGEHGEKGDPGPGLWGSSPLARGAPLKVQVRGHPAGLIPARAGSTTQRLSRPSMLGAHPRSRGEHTAVIIADGEYLGSSPLARGALVRRQPRNTLGRLIPARAGSTVACARAGVGARAHPRSRGEHEVPGTGIVTSWGSSPLARGARDGCLVGEPRGRLIPARAGSTGNGARPPTGGTAHPRSRGEH